MLHIQDLELGQLGQDAGPDWTWQKHLGQRLAYMFSRPPFEGRQPEDALASISFHNASEEGPRLLVREDAGTACQCKGNCSKPSCSIDSLWWRASTTHPLRNEAKSGGNNFSKSKAHEIIAQGKTRYSGHHFSRLSRIRPNMRK